MQLRSGIPTLDDLENLKRSELFSRHLQFNRGFIDKHSAAMADYGRHWALDQLRLWSRRWEYPYVAQRLIQFAERHPDRDLKILDAGSGVTYFPYFIVDQLPQAEFTCCDYDSSYARQFQRINADRSESRVRFLQADLRQLPLDSSSVDAICCISVLEHTDSYDRIIDEFARLLKPGGLFVLTFDLSLDGKFPLSSSSAARMLGILRERFEFSNGFDPLADLRRIRDDGILSTDHVRATEPELLPWSKPVRAYKAMQDLLGGKGWTGGFRSLTVFCLEMTNNRQ